MSKEVIVLHESEDALNHRVLKPDRLVHARDFAGEVMPHAEVLRSPGNALAHAHESGSDAGRGHRGFSAMHISSQMRLDAASQIEAAFDRRMNRGDGFKSHHGRTRFQSVSELSSAKAA